MELSGETIIKKSELDLISSMMGKELMTMEMESGNYIHFNEIGTNIWEYLDSINTIQGLVSKLTKVYDISQEKCIIEVTQFINHLVSIDLVVINSN